MNNEDMKLQINPEFENMIPELTDDELSQLEENILAEGRIVNPIVVWNGVIVDGHNRYKIAQKHPHIQFTVHEKEFESEQEAQIWICSNQLGRRNLTEQHKKYLGERDIILNATEQNSMETNIHVPMKVVRAETAQTKTVMAHVLESLTSLASASGRYVPLRSSQRA